MALRIKAEKENNAPAASSSKGTGGKTASTSKSSVKAGAKTPPEAKVQDSQRVKDYRLEVWRKALRLSPVAVVSALESVQLTGW